MVLQQRFGTLRFTMHKRKTTLLFLTISLGVFFAAPSQMTGQNKNTGASIKVGIVKDNSLSEEGGCSLQLPVDLKRKNERFVFLNDYGENAVMNIDGKDVKFKLVSHHQSTEKAKKGDRSTWTYAARGTTVRVDFVVTGVCPPNDESCEVTSYDATITVTRGGSQQQVLAKGQCGS